MDFDPPFQQTYKTLLPELGKGDKAFAVEEYELPSINLSHLLSPNQNEREKCIDEIVRAASTWGFFQVVNHGISDEVLKNMNYEEKKVFHQPFEKKVQKNFLGLSPDSYRWGNPKATSLKQLSWSEAFHICMEDLSGMNESKTLRFTMEKFAKTARGLAKTLAEILADNLGMIKTGTYFQENCPPNSSYIRMNRYPPCPYSSSKLVCGLIPHTDSDFLSVVFQDHVGGLQLLKDGKWIAVKPNPNALVINIGDLFQALSNGVYKSIRHRVIATEVERFSVAYFYCPSNDAIIESCGEEPAVYKQFTFGEYKIQNEKDVEDIGDKIGLQRFLRSYI
ncbi:Gibberellin 2-beta-dioxygenase 8 [Morus notabilis]|uniref:Gibberellin 2-beta-dioxygenase 8 n=2 Tax=Morus notabilis TaxID=981085 RepID=W9RZU7_9ROSA|nr:Gibberellin 2-beta-dioxygenase 8 [Morus notabilis]